MDTFNVGEMPQEEALAWFLRSGRPELLGPASRLSSFMELEEGSVTVHTSVSNCRKVLGTGPVAVLAASRRDSNREEFEDFNPKERRFPAGGESSMSYKPCIKEGSDIRLDITRIQMRYGQFFRARKRVFPNTEIHALMTFHNNSQRWHNSGLFARHLA